MASENDGTRAVDLEDGTSVITTAQTSQTEVTVEPPTQTPIYISTTECVTLTKRKGRYHLAKQYRLKNSLLAGVGFLELANAGDFAANVWNQIPVPRFAAVLMGIGGTVALATSSFAFRDAQLSRRNILLLREERRYLQQQKADPVQQAETARDIASELDVNFREMGTELVDRFGMDIILGFGAVLVGIGTIMAIGGADPLVFQASNLMSGYIGNAPIALYGMINAAWSAYIWRRARRHGIAGEKELETDSVKLALRRRIRTVKIHAALNGVSGIVAGGASLVTATMWYGYPILAVCTLTAIFCNFFWRSRIGYDRPLVRSRQIIDKTSLIGELESVTSTQKILKKHSLQSLNKLVSDPDSITLVIEFLTKHDLFEDFCIRLLKDTSLSMSLFGTLGEELVIDPQMLVKADKICIPRCLEIAQVCVTEMGLTRFQYRERYLQETLGCYMCTLGVEATSEKC